MDELEIVENDSVVLTDVPELEYNDTYDEVGQFEKNVYFDY